MNYQRIYNQIIERARTRQLTCYKEKHHIVPKCMGGNNDLSNLIELTGREHFLCHRLLCRIYPNEGKLKNALWLMANYGRKKGVYKINARLYEKLRLDYSNFMNGKNHSDETKLKMSKTRKNKPSHRKGKKLTLEHCLKISKNKQNKKQKRTKINNINKGIKFSKERYNQHVNSIKKSKNIPIIQYDSNMNFINEWESGKEASRKLDLYQANIYKCCTVNKKYSINKLNKVSKCSGFIFKFKII